MRVMIISFEKQNKHMHPFETICGYACVQELFMTSPQKKIRKTVVFLAWFPQNRQLSFTNFQHVFSYQFCFLVGGGGYQPLRSRAEHGLSKATSISTDKCDAIHISTIPL